MDEWTIIDHRRAGVRRGAEKPDTGDRLADLTKSIGRLT
jgi:hypothetical protein